jgi:hypothetical protein
MGQTQKPSAAETRPQRHSCTPQGWSDFLLSQQASDAFDIFLLDDRGQIQREMRAKAMLTSRGMTLLPEDGAEVLDQFDFGIAVHPFEVASVLVRGRNNGDTWELLQPGTHHVLRGDRYACGPYWWPCE